MFRLHIHESNDANKKQTHEQRIKCGSPGSIRMFVGVGINHYVDGEVASFAFLYVKPVVPIDWTKRRVAEDGIAFFSICADSLGL
ncbi:hypothetical protein DPMN_164271 [Dreissena polymorpha]|uniref:Uncharacterized protein n=1 Tax=Dreissena polymorpha TaxID=45954 RepID=A0A9D4IVY7_DREPO|nr:hypothetical protein DPMN_164271 [Dreissena polymorpha]